MIDSFKSWIFDEQIKLVKCCQVLNESPIVSFLDSGNKLLEMTILAKISISMFMHILLPRRNNPDEP